MYPIHDDNFLLLSSDEIWAGNLIYISETVLVNDSCHEEEATFVRIIDRKTTSPSGKFTYKYLPRSFGELSGHSQCHECIKKSSIFH